ALLNCSIERWAVVRLVISDPITNTTPVAMWPAIDESVTAMTGGVSMITQSTCSPSVLMNSLKRFEPSSSAGLGGIMPDGITQSPGTFEFLTDSLALAL